MIMKQLEWVTALILAGAGMVSAQSLGDYAREIKKNKADTGTATKVYDNDNIPTDSTLSVVGPAPADEASKAAADKAAETAATDAKAEQQKANDALQKGMEEQKQKIDALNKELDLLQREYRLQAATFYADAGNRLRDSAQWDKDQANYKSEIDAKQKEIEAARGKLDEMQEDARKAGIRQKDADDNSKSTETSKAPDTNTDAGK
jgi:hypothetical protein